jgi:hypothetical protein
MAYCPAQYIIVCIPVEMKPPDFIKGKTLADSVLLLGKEYADYFHNHLPFVLDEFIELVKAIRFLHKNGEKHGDIGRRGISKKEEFMFGSTSTRILHIAKDCSIWVIE